MTGPLTITHAHAALARALETAAGEAGAVVHLGPAALRSARLDDALIACVDETRAAVADAAARGVPVVLASTLAAVGRKSGLVAEEDPRASLFGGGTVRGKDLDVDAEIAACRREVEHARASSRFADHLSKLADETRTVLLEAGGASTGGAFDRAFAAAQEKELGRALERALVERASSWRFATGSGYAARGYPAALAELVLVAAAESAQVPWAIVRLPDVLDDDDGALAWLLERVHAGVVRLPLVDGARLEALPRARVAEALAVVVRGIAASREGGVVHVTAGDPSTGKSAGGGPLLTVRLTDLLDLHLRRRRTARDDSGASDERGALPMLARALSVDSARGRDGLLGAGTALAASALELARSFVPDGAVPEKIKDVVDETGAALRSLVEDDPSDRARAASPPFFVEDTRFSQRGLRVFAARAGAAVDAAKAPPLGWREALLDEHLPALEESRVAREKARAKLPKAAYDSLAHLLIEAADRYRTRPALSLVDGDQIVDVTYAELLARARAVAGRLQQAGVARGDRILLAGQNHPAWGICAFGAFFAGVVLVPLDPGLDDDAIARIVKKARPKLAVVDKTARAKWAASLPERVLDLHLTATAGSEEARHDDDQALPSGEDTASILFTSGTTGEPKGVELTHKNFTALLSSLQSIFPVGRGDRLLSVLPLHHTFEFSGGLLMPLAAGARIYTPDALTGERVLFALKTGKITAMVGVPALWQLLERRIQKQAAERGDVVKGILDALLSANRALGKRTGLSFGRIVLKPIHDELGGHLRTLISGGSALPPSVHELFQGLGLPLAEGYGLTEAAPVLTVAEGILGAPAGTVGRPIPGVELRVVDPDPVTGAGEIWARAPNVMKGYFEDRSATDAAIVDGWLKTGDLGKIDGEGRLRILGRSKDVVVTASGENVYLDDVEKKLENVDGVAELTLLGLSDPRGGERLALAWVLAENTDVADAGKALTQRILKLPAFARPAVIERVDGPLPLTATRKVKRKDVKKALEERLAAREAEGVDESEAPMTAVRAAIALVAGVEMKKLAGHTRLPQDLGFDSLMWTELGAALEPLAGAVDPELLVAQESVAAIENLVRGATNDAARAPLGNAATANGSGGSRGSARGNGVDGAGDAHDAHERDAHARTAHASGAHAGGTTARAGTTHEVRAAAPPTRSDATIVERLADRLSDVAFAVAKPLGRAAITALQREAYRSLFSATVSGRANIPHNRSSIVVANHTSHLDTGLVKFALGDYGRDLKPLAAKDYFFEGARPKVAFFEHFTNLVPIDRETGSGLAFEQARAVVDGGHVVLIFPEGTRREDGTLGAFKPLVARLSLLTGKDVLPIWMKGNYQALPRGTLVPNFDARDLEAHIGPPLEAVHLARLTGHLAPVQQARAATEIIRRAVVALSEGRMLDLARATSLDALEHAVIARPAA